MQLLCSWIPLIKVLSLFHGLILSALTSWKYIQHYQRPFSPRTLTLRNADVLSLISNEGWGCRSLCVLYCFFDFKSLHPCPKDRMSLGPPQPHPNAAAAAPAAAAAKSLQSCPTLCDPIDGSPPGSPVPGILQARTLQWGAISFSNAWKWKVKVKSLSHVRLLATPWTAAYQAPPSMGFSRQEYWSGVPLPSPSEAKLDPYPTYLYRWISLDTAEWQQCLGLSPVKNILIQWTVHQGECGDKAVNKTDGVFTLGSLCYQSIQSLGILSSVFRRTRQFYLIEFLNFYFFNKIWLAFLPFL